MKWLIVGVLFAIAFGKTDGVALVQNTAELVRVAAPYAHEFGTAIGGSVQEVERVTQGSIGALQEGPPTATPPARPRSQAVPAGTAAAARRSDVATYQPVIDGRDPLSDGVINLDVITDRTFGVPTTMDRGSAFYASPDVVITADHVVVGSERKLVSMAGGTLWENVIGEAWNLDVAVLTPWVTYRGATPFYQPVPTVFHPLANRLTVEGETLVALCRYSKSTPIYPATLVVVNPDTTIGEQMADGRTHLVSHGILLRTTTESPYGVWGGCSGAPLVDATGAAVGVMVAASDDGVSTIAAAGSVPIIGWLHALQIAGY